jgi:phytoene/squalene synthetase
MDLYLQTSFKTSKLITKSYSTSFSWGIKAFSKEYRNAIYGIYGFVRLADEIVDTFHDQDKKKLLDNLREETFISIKNGLSTNPIIHSFQKVVNQFNIDYGYITAFLDSMEMDLTNSSYGREKYDNYIYGSAEAVGLMCLQVFVKNDKKLFAELIEPAKALGSAFQKVNFLRDIKSDLKERGRIYLPDIHSTTSIDDSTKKRLEKEVEEEFKIALKGIMQLPNGVKLGVYSAYLYYFVLLQKIKSLNINELFTGRIRVSNYQKLMLLIKSFIKIRLLKWDLVNNVKTFFIITYSNIFYTSFFS